MKLIKDKGEVIGFSFIDNDKFNREMQQEVFDYHMTEMELNKK